MTTYRDVFEKYLDGGANALSAAERALLESPVGNAALRDHLPDLDPLVITAQLQATRDMTTGEVTIWLDGGGAQHVIGLSFELLEDTDPDFVRWSGLELDIGALHFDVIGVCWHRASLVARYREQQASTLTLFGQPVAYTRFKFPTLPLRFGTFDELGRPQGLPPCPSP